jgi:hypothetical protein
MASREREDEKMVCCFIESGSEVVIHRRGDFDFLAWLESGKT